MDFFGLDLELHRDVYVPREDTYLMVEVLEEELDHDMKVLDMGTGTGVLSLVAARECSEVVGVDVSSEAVDLARKNSSKNGIENVEFLRSDLFERVEGTFDLILFNAPYLPGEEDEREVEGSHQWFGGEEGVEIIEAFSEEVENYLSVRGKILLLISSSTGLDETKEIFTEKGFKVNVEGEKKIPWETLYVLGIRK